MHKRSRLFSSLLLAISLISLFFLSPVYADNEVNGESQNNIYVGLGGGFNNSHTNIDLTRYVEVANQIIPQTADAKLNNNGFVALAVLGYHIQLSSRFFTNLEVFGSINMLNTMQKWIGDFEFNRVGMRNNFGFSVNPGISAGDSTDIFVRVGVAGGQLNSEISGVDDISVTIPGLIVGGGVETVLNRLLSLRFEYIHGSYRNFIRDLSNGIREKYNPSANQAVVSLIIRVG